MVNNEKAHYLQPSGDKNLNGDNSIIFDRMLHNAWYLAMKNISHYLNQCWNIVDWTIIGINLNDILIEIQTFSLKMCVKISSATMAAIFSRLQCV